MIKDRFGGLFSDLNARDVKTLRDFDFFVHNTEEVYNLSERNQPQPTPLTERAMIPNLRTFGDIYYKPAKEHYEDTGEEVTEEALVNIVLSGSYEDIYNHYKDVYEELARQCSEPEFTSPRYKPGVSFRQENWMERWLGEKGDPSIPDTDADWDLQYRDVSIQMKKQCRVWLNRLAPIIKKLKKLVSRSQNQALD